jgi:hypothetical protein
MAAGVSVAGVPALALTGAARGNSNPIPAKTKRYPLALMSCALTKVRGVVMSLKATKYLFLKPILEGKLPAKMR